MTNIINSPEQYRFFCAFTILMRSIILILNIMSQKSYQPKIKKINGQPSWKVLLFLCRMYIHF